MIRIINEVFWQLVPKLSLVTTTKTTAYGQRMRPTYLPTLSTFPFFWQPVALGHFSLYPPEPMPT